MSTTTRKAREAEKRKASNQKFLKELAGESPAEVTYDDPSSKVKKITSLKEIPAEALLQLSSNSDENKLLMMIYYAAKKGKISNRFRLNIVIPKHPRTLQEGIHGSSKSCILIS
jgi:hypothetical protein